MKRGGLLDEFKRLYRSSGITVQIILVNVVVFLTFQLALLLDTLFLNGNITASFLHIILTCSADLKLLAVTPWTLITYMFTHSAFGHIFFNMLIFFFAGRILERYIPRKKFIGVYIVGGLIGSVLYVASYNFFPVFSNMTNSSLLGASGSVLAIVMALGTYLPEMEVAIFGIFRVKLKWMATFMGVWFVVFAVGLDNAGGHIAHIGGVLYGAYFGWKYRIGKDILKWYDRFINRVGNLFRKNPKMKVKYYNAKKHMKSSKQDHNYNISKIAKQEIIDSILDKISKSGYESLTREEKSILFDASNENK